jgi:hypothetical protein
MTVRRACMSGVGAAVVALVLSGCGASPLLPPFVAVTSPFSGSSVHALTGSDQLALVRLCSLTGGPLTVDVTIPGADFQSGLGVRVTSVDDPTSVLLQFNQEQQVGVSTHLESSRPIAPGECIDVAIASREFFFDPGLPFSYTLTW